MPVYYMNSYMNYGGVIGQGRAEALGVSCDRSCSKSHSWTDLFDSAKMRNFSSRTFLCMNAQTKETQHSKGGVCNRSKGGHREEGDLRR